MNTDMHNTEVAAFVAARVWDTRNAHMDLTLWAIRDEETREAARKAAVRTMWAEVKEAADAAQDMAGVYAAQAKMDRYGRANLWTAREHQEAKRIIEAAYLRVR